MSIEWSVIKKKNHSVLYLNGDKLGVWASGKYFAISADEPILETEWNELAACTPSDVCWFGLGTRTGALADWVTICCFCCSLVNEIVSVWWSVDSDFVWAKISKISFSMFYIFHFYYLFDEDDDFPPLFNLIFFVIRWWPTFKKCSLRIIKKKMFVRDRI